MFNLLRIILTFVPFFFCLFSIVLLIVNIIFLYFSSYLLIGYSLQWNVNDKSKIKGKKENGANFVQIGRLQNFTCTFRILSIVPVLSKLVSACAWTGATRSMHIFRNKYLEFSCFFERFKNDSIRFTGIYPEYAYIHFVPRWSLSLLKCVFFIWLTVVSTISYAYK